MELKSIHDIFKNRILRIPSYQRGYSWGNNTFPTHKDDLKNIKGQLIDLWNDIQNLPEGKWHYTGLLTLRKRENKNNEINLPKNYQQFAIVDGQQRITSILILISVLIKFAKQYNHHYNTCNNTQQQINIESHYLYISDSTSVTCIFGYEQDNPSNKFFQQDILGLNTIVFDDSKESIYTDNLLKAYNFFEQMVHFHIADQEDKKLSLTNLYTKVTNNLKLNEYVLPEELDEYVVFETMNNRGKALSQLEMLKNRLMYLTDKLEVSNNIRKDLIDSINRSWITIYQSLGVNKNNPLKDDDFIEAHWIMYFNEYNRAKANVYSNHLFNKYFTIERLYDKESEKLNESKILKYVQSLQESSRIWSKMHNVEFITDERLKESMRRIYRLGSTTMYEPLILAALLQPDINMNQFDQMINAIENFSFKVFYASNYQANTGNSILYTLAGHLYNKSKTIQDCVDRIQKSAQSYYKLEFFQSLVENLFTQQHGYYSWKGIRLFLYEYDQHLRLKNKNDTGRHELIWKDFKNKKTIEHIYPQSACQSEDNLNGNWDAFKGFNSQQKNRLCNSLGNLLALTSSDNSSFSNDAFKYKVDQSLKGEAYINRGYIHNSMSAQIVAKQADWTAKQIKNRGLEMIDFLLYKLGESNYLLTDSEKLKLLGIDFLVE